jgi:iron complex outermembrane receptor protein
LGGRRTDINGSLEGNRFIPRELRDDEFVVENYGSQTELTGQFNTGAIAHQLLLGFELSRKTSFYDRFSADLPPIDIFDPVYEVPRPTDLPNAFKLRDRIDALGIYLQDRVTLTDNLKLLVGGRFDFTEQKENYPVDGTINNQSDEAFSPRIGIVYQPIEPISLYASYSRSFVPVVGRSATNSPFIPSRGTQYEVGIKADLSDRVFATLAAYQITKTNVPTTNPNNPDFSIQVGEQRSRGIELDIAGEILPGWKIITSYTYTNAEVTEDNALPVGSRLANVPEHSASLWTTYEIQRGSLQGLGFGLGVFYVAERPGFADSDPPEFELPSYLRTDAAVYYRRNNWKLGLNIRNLFDINYYETHQGNDIVYPGAPFTVIGSFSMEF